MIQSWYEKYNEQNQIMIEQNYEIIKLLKAIEKNTR